MEHVISPDLLIYQVYIMIATLAVLLIGLLYAYVIHPRLTYTNKDEYTSTQRIMSDKEI